MPLINANSVDADQMPHSAASDLGLHCLPMSHLWDIKHKWVKFTVKIGYIKNSFTYDYYGTIEDNVFYFCTKRYLVGSNHKCFC